MDEGIVSLAREYIALVDYMRSGSFSYEEIGQLDSQRQTVHYQLCEVLGLDHDALDMYERASDMLYRHRKAA